MFRTKWKFITAASLLFILISGNLTYAAENFFWSDTEPTPSCYTSREGDSSNIGLVVDGKREQQDIPTCAEAKKNRVLVLVNGKYLQTIFGSGAEPFIENGRTMIPLRALADGFGFEVTWKPSEQKIVLEKGNQTIILFIGQSEMQVDGKKVALENAVPMIKNGVTFLPVRQLAEVLGVKVNWDNKTRTATFSDNNDIS
ncbi:copper amine oxidase N-terminal domain-containing protein [Paenibacillus solani]|uniref:copper amine oxidase N-terminal domain-containing protein n=1 Tax=Paenibacillus solani TaxID=1705565 RepID=UPI003D29196E